MQPESSLPCSRQLTTGPPSSRNISASTFLPYFCETIYLSRIFENLKASSWGQLLYLYSCIYPKPFCFLRGSGIEKREYGRGDLLRWPSDTLYPQKLALTSPTGGGHSVGMVRSRTKVTEFLWGPCSVRSKWAIDSSENALFCCPSIYSQVFQLACSFQVSCQCLSGITYVSFACCISSTSSS
jgi:hypothetical protein